MGLLPPARVNIDNGYRYYTERQVARARFIGHLRQIES
jgi:DNA-binding transcriptional MerR regulator